MKRTSPFPSIGILGGGQLGKMLCLAAGPLHLEVHVLDADNHFPAAPYCHRFVKGDFANEADVLAFAKDLDIITVEIEAVSIEALRKLRDAGKKVFPDPELLALIQDKGLQKLFYLSNDIPTAPFVLYQDAATLREAVALKMQQLPFVQKLRKGGYDGRGVHVVRNEHDLQMLLEGPCLVEELVPFETEIAVIVARNESGEVSAFDAVSMAFHPSANLVEMLVCPAEVSKSIQKKALALAIEVAESFDLIGLLAVEMFVTKAGKVLVNEVAPRPHNSGHHTIEACNTSQYEQHLRAILNWPLGDTRLLSPAVMINLLGAENHSGPVVYRAWEDCLAMPGVHLHIYGKAETRPFRKMGHGTVLAKTVQKAQEIARKVQDTLRIESE